MPMPAQTLQPCLGRQRLRRLAAGSKVALLLAWLLISPGSLTAADQTGWLARAEIEIEPSPGRAGQPVVLRVVLDPADPPSGFFISSLVDVLKAPEAANPEILPGYPEIVVTCDTPGRYLLAVRVNMVTKSSCGGVQTAPILEREVTLIIEP